MENHLSGIDSFVRFTNSQGSKGRGTVIHITRSAVVFEVYNPYSIVQLSEVLQNVQVMRGERTIYDGRAVVSNMVSTGLMVIVSATLVDPWVDLVGLAPGKALIEETERFINDWETGNRLEPEYQLIVSTMGNFLSELNHWLVEAEARTITKTETDQTDELRRTFFEDVIKVVLPKMTDMFDDFEVETAKIDPEEIMVHKSFARRVLHPFMLCSPFVHRSFIKPLGYAGDYEMVNMMLKVSNAVSPNVYAKIMDSFCVESPVPKAHRNRIVMLEERLTTEARRVIQNGRLFTVLNVGCGPALEVQRFIRNDTNSNQAILRLMDFNDETIEYAQKKIQQAIEESGNRPMIKFINKSIDTLLKEVHKESPEGPYDMVYCAGLFDYFSDQVCAQLLQLYFTWLRPGGLLTATNVHADNPYRFFMEHLLEWHIFHRDEKDMARIAPNDPDARVNVIPDTTGMNVFLDIRKQKC